MLPFSIYILSSAFWLLGSVGGKPGFPFLYAPRQFVGLHFLGTSTSITCGVMRYLRVAKSAAKYSWPGQELYYL